MFLIVLLLALAGTVSAQQRWTRSYGGSNQDWGNSVQQTSDGGYIVAGFTTSFGAGNWDVYLIKTNANGDTLWTKTYGGSNQDWGNSVQQTSDGGYIIAGGTASFGAGNGDVYLIKTYANGDTLWTRTYGGTNQDFSNFVRQTLDGGYIIAGGTNTFGAGNYDFYLIKTNASGGILWTRTYGGTNWDVGCSVQQTTDGGYIVAGQTNSFGNAWQVYLIKTNATGDTLWTRTYGGTSSDEGYSVQQTSDGGYIVAGYTDSFGNSNQVYLVKTNASGDTLWTRTCGGASWDGGYSVQQTTDGGYIVAGYTYPFGTDPQVYLIKTNASGDTLWTRTYGGADDDWGFSVQQTSDGGYIVAGYTFSFGNLYQVYLIKTNATGDTLWTRAYGGASDDGGYSVQQTTDGGYIVSGETSSFGNGYQVYLIKTDANGSSGVEETAGGRGVRDQGLGIRVTARPNPFASFATIPGHEAERFSLYDVSGRKVGTYKGDRVGEGLAPGVYFLKYQEMLKQVQHDEIVRIVKVR